MRLLDLFCGAGGCAVGYHRAGFTEVVGVDCRPQPRYPFAFVQGDALEYLRDHGRDFDAIHASPPCQRYSISSRLPNHRPDHPDLVEPTRVMLESIGRPWVIENVPGAPLVRPVDLCGTMLGLRVRRHRLFESSVPLVPPASPCRHRPGDVGVRVGKFTACGSCAKKYRTGRGTLQSRPRSLRLSDASAAMGIDWMDATEIGQAIPPAYTQHVGCQLIAHLRARPFVLALAERVYGQSQLLSRRAERA